MKKLIAVLALTLLILCSCTPEQETELKEAYDDLTPEEQAQVQEAAQDVVGQLTVEPQEMVSSAIEQEIKKKMVASGEIFYLEKNELVLDRPSTIIAAVSNIGQLDDVFEINSMCTKNARIITPVSISVGVGEIKTFELELNPQGIEKGNYICPVVVSTNGEEVSKTLMIKVI
jgi:hypothetical protein